MTEVMLNCYRVLFENAPVTVVVDSPFLEYDENDTWADLVVAKSRAQARYIAGSARYPSWPVTEFPISSVVCAVKDVAGPARMVTDSAPIEWWGDSVS
jgi:hypothetical protein